VPTPPTAKSSSDPFAEQPRIRRTLLITPGNRPERIAKATTLAADGLVLDLEDGVAPADKALARRCIAEALDQLDFGQRERIIRLNGCATDEQARDLDALPIAAIATLMVPKVEHPRELVALSQRLDALEAAAGVRRPVEIIASIETPRGLLAALQIAEASPRVTALFFGSGDYSLATGSAVTERALAMPRALIVAAAAAAGRQAIDAAYFANVTDTAATEQDAQVARELGFIGKLLFHPSQIAPCNCVFSPSDAEIAKAQRIIAAYEKAAAEGKGTALVDGTFIAVDIALMAHRTLAMAARVSAMS
jgi:citrate lyase subunit beta/citryl-CoA lyase